MAFSIREATVADTHLAADIIRQSFRTVAQRFALTAENCPKHPSNCDDQWISDALSKGTRVFIGEQDGLPCGCVALEAAKPGLWYLERLAVLPSSRRKGCGKALVCHALAQAKNLGGDHVDIGIIAEDAELRQWYARIGFKVTREAVTFDHLPFTVTFMTLALP